MTDMVTKVLIVVLALAIAGSAKFFLKMEDDNPVEQAAEQVIKYNTGYVVDLSPERVPASKVDGSIDLVHSF